MEGRKCTYCGTVLVRGGSRGNLEKLRDFRRRKFCDKRCAGLFQKEGLKPGVAEAVKEAAENADSTSPEKKKTGLEVLEDIANDSKVDASTRVNAAKALAQHQEKAKGPKGKKEERADAAGKAAGGRFGSRPAPKIVNLKK